LGLKFIQQLQPFVYPKFLFQHPGEAAARMKARIETELTADKNIKLVAEKVETPPRVAPAVPWPPADGVPQVRSDRARRRRILVVDDEPAIRDFLGRMLGRIGYEPVVAADGDEALEIVRSDPPDAILCDHRMAGMTGAAFNDAVAATSPDLARRFAFMTGDVTNPDLRAIATARGVALLAKPFDMTSVQATLERILAG
jgi:CheY-like chemotaxis protein